MSQKKEQLGDDSIGIFVKGMVQATEHLGPFHKNPKIDEVYRTLRVMGATRDEAIKMIKSEIKRRKKR